MKREILAAALIALVSLTAGVFLYARQNFAIFLGKAQISQIVDQAQPAETNNNGILAEPSESLADADISYRESGRQTADKIGHDLTKLEENAEPLPKAQTIIEETAKETKGAKAKKTKGAGFETKWCEFTDYYAQGKIILNEVAWMGTAANYADEWIELKNAAGREIDLDGWQLRNKSGSIGIVFPEKSAMSAGGLFLLERSDDDSVAGVKADLIYTGSLANSKEELFLFDANCELQDRVVAAPGWPGGSNKTKQTLERAANSLWQTSEYPGGTPKKENSAGDTTIVADSEAVLTSDAGGSDTSYSPRIFIGEIMYNPEGSDEGREWVEIYNDGSDPANLAGWKFTTGRTDHSLSLIQGSFSLPANGYALIANATSSTAIDVGFSGNFYRASFSLRNGTSGIEPIFLKDGTAIIDQAGYESSWGANGNDKSLQRKTFGLSGLDPQNWQAEIPSPGSKNVFAGSDPDQLASNIDSGKTTATSTEEILAPPAGDAAAAPDIIDYPPSDNATTTAAASFSVVINEIAWMGTATSTYDEWIELYNASGRSVDLAGGRIDKNGLDFIEFDAKTLANATSTIETSGFYLIERKTSSKTGPQILNPQGQPLTDLLTSFGSGLNNNGEILELFDAQGNRVDWFDCRDGWFAGTSRNKNALTMTRKLPLRDGGDPQSWQNSSETGGTPKKENR